MPKNESLWQRGRYALRGVREAFRREASFRWEVMGAAGGLVILLLVRPPLVWWALVVVLTAAVLAMELLNTAVEHLADVVQPNHHPIIGLVKDFAAGAVLVLSVASLAVAGLLLYGWAQGTL